MTVRAVTPLVRKPLARATHVWGVDTSATKGAAVAFWDLNTNAFQTNTVTWAGDAKNPGRRLMECRAAAVQFGEAMRQHFPPAAIVVERPTGRYPKPALMMHTGVIAEALGTGAGMAPYFAAVKEWRALLGAGLNGSSNKQQIVEWAGSVGWRDGSEDEAEALGIAYSGVVCWRKALVA